MSHCELILSLLQQIASLEGELDSTRKQLDQHKVLATTQSHELSKAQEELASYSTTTESLKVCFCTVAT